MPNCCSCMSNGRCKRCDCVKAGHSCVDFWPSKNVPKRCLNVIPSDNSDEPISSSVSGGNFLQCSAITPEMCDNSHDTSESFTILVLVRLTFWLTQIF